MSNKTPQSQPDKFIVETLKSGGTKYSIKIGDWVIQFSHDADESVGVVTLSKGSEIHWQSVYDGEQEPPLPDINAGDIPTPSKGQETKEEGWNLASVSPPLLNERMPESVLCYTDSWDMMSGYFQAGKWIFEGTGESFERLGYNVTHWRQLPAPPNSEQGVQECDASKAK